MTTRDGAASAADESITDLVAVGRPVIANPNLVIRRHKGADEDEVHQASVYGGGEDGYTDYPFLQE